MWALARPRYINTGAGHLPGPVARDCVPRSGESGFRVGPHACVPRLGESGFGVNSWRVLSDSAVLVTGDELGFSGLLCRGGPITCVFGASRYRGVGSRLPRKSRRCGHSPDRGTQAKVALVATRRYRGVGSRLPRKSRRGGHLPDRGTQAKVALVATRRYRGVGSRLPVDCLAVVGTCQTAVHRQRSPWSVRAGSVVGPGSGDHFYVPRSGEPGFGVNTWRVLSDSAVHRPSRRGRCARGPVTLVDAGPIRWSRRRATAAPEDTVSAVS